MAKRKLTRADVEAEIGQARRVGEESVGYINEGQAYRSVEEGDPQLREADLSGVDLSNLGLEDAQLDLANLREAILDGAVLAGANLKRADLTGTTRTAGADLTGAYLGSAVLAGADLSWAILRPEDHENPYLARPLLPRFLEGAIYDDRTRWPHGFDPDAHGARRARRAPR
ncbi:MAG: hypothetical protein AVDCRST_MAG05-4053 [uncultured Rubrobacteraceae bacterium]|uniref:Pentapeptide repeat family protein n=1 Tax=uncultured Rubrobacteraceae bacterium TaxID=349277 RepID=A0A6J4TM26_9ACTN|nr:MAG: hypothetical protein AVDCRST_MAG05-4053 [uncultured Rubrobacteraceae bacterium]